MALAALLSSKAPSPNLQRITDLTRRYRLCLVDFRASPYDIESHCTEQAYTNVILQHNSEEEIIHSKASAIYIMVFIPVLLP